MKNRQCGVAAVELALVLPLLLAICFAITEFGRAIYTYDALAKSARGASRYLSSESAGNATGKHDIAKKLVVYGNPAGTGSPLVPGLNIGMVDICDALTCSSSNANVGSTSFPPLINTVTVTIKGYTFNPLIDILGFTRFYTGGTSSITSITFGDISVTMRQS